MTNADMPTAIPTKKPRKPFPAWRLPNGMTSAGDAELEKSIESCERWEWFGGGLVVVGVVAAVAIAAAHPRYDSFLEQWGSAVADSLVAIGVAIEIRFGQMAGFRQNELKRRSDERVGAANARAADAELQAEKLRKELSWRRLSRQQIEKISESLSRPEFPKFCLRIVHSANDPESMTFAGDIADVFRASDWRVQFISTVTSNRFSGLMIPLYAGPDFDACGITRMALTNAGIDFVAGDPPPFSGMMMADGDEISGPKADLVIGSKPPPNFG